MPKQNGFLVVLAADLFAGDDLPQFGMQVFSGDLVEIDVAAQCAEWQPLAALPPIVPPRPLLMMSVSDSSTALIVP